MGAQIFYDTIKGTDARKAFSQLVEQACYEYGHGGYSGTIAEKTSFAMSNKPEEISANEWADMVEDFDEMDKNNQYYYELKRDFKVYDDKWGPALCIKDGDGFVFCGWASC